MAFSRTAKRFRDRDGLRVATCAAASIGRIVFAFALMLPLATAQAASPTACGGDCNGDGTVTIDDVIVLVNIAGGSETTAVCLAGDLDANAAITIDEIVVAVGHVLQGCPVVGTATPSPSPTPEPSPTALGRRRFVIDPSASSFEAILDPRFILKVGGFRGQTGGVVEDAYLDLEAGIPDATGMATIAVVGGSEYIFVDGANVGLVLCLKPQLPVSAAGVVACKGGLDFSIVTAIDHNVGQVGVDGFDVQQCDAAGGTVEGRNRICATGNTGQLCRSDADCGTGAVCGLDDSTCAEGRVGEPCRSDAQCDPDPEFEEGVCGTAGAHPGVCNGLLDLDQSLGDSGPGAAIIAPVPQLNISGLPLVLAIENSLPCGDENGGRPQPFAMTTARTRATIANFNNGDSSLELERTGRNFSCTDWSSAPARFVLNFPALHQFQGSDVLTVFTFEDRGAVQ